MGKKARPKRHSRKRKLLLLALVVVIVSVLSTAVYAVSYTQSTDALNHVYVYCVSYSQVYHPPSTDPHQGPFTHYVVQFGVNNTSSADADALWKITAINQTWPDYTSVGDQRAFSLPHRSTASPSFGIYVNQANMTVHPWELSVSESYGISLFTFERSFIPSPTLPSCP